MISASDINGAGNSLLRTEQLVKRYKQRTVVNGVSIQVSAGEIVGLLGPNGAGKTTTISVVTGLANYSSGSVRVFGFDVMTQYRESRRLIGLVPQVTVWVAMTFILGLLGAGIALAISGATVKQPLPVRS